MPAPRQPAARKRLLRTWPGRWPSPSASTSHRPATSTSPRRRTTTRRRLLLPGRLPLRLPWSTRPAAMSAAASGCQEGADRSAGDDPTELWGSGSAPTACSTSPIPVKTASTSSPRTALFVHAFGKEVNLERQEQCCTGQRLSGGSTARWLRTGPCSTQSTSAGARVGNSASSDLRTTASTSSLQRPLSSRALAKKSTADRVNQPSRRCARQATGPIGRVAVHQPAGMAVGSWRGIVVAFDEISRVSEFDFGGNFVRAFGEGVVKSARRPFRSASPAKQTLPSRASRHDPGRAGTPEHPEWPWIARAPSTLPRCGSRFRPGGAIRRAWNRPRRPCPPTTGTRPTKPSNKFRFVAAEAEKEEGDRDV